MKPIPVMVNGLPGNMAREVAEQVLEDERVKLVPYSLTGPEIEDSQAAVKGTTVSLVKAQERIRILETIRKTAGRDFVTVDFTLPSAVNENARFYCSQELPFVMGTTGGDRQELLQTVKSSNTAAVIAPNMAKQIVGFQAMMAYAADHFPNLFEGYRLRIRESHQQGKADTSGTAKAMVTYFNRLGISFSEEQIEKERNPERQVDAWGVPQEYVGGHGWHTYALTSADGTVRFEFTHNVNGRRIYGRGTLDAVVFLDAKVRKGARGKVFSMIDVLQAG